MAKKARKGSSAKKRGSITISIDLTALEKLYKRRYDISLDGGGDTKAGSVKIIKGGGAIRIRDGDTKGGAVKLPTGPGEEKTRRKR